MEKSTRYVTVPYPDAMIFVGVGKKRLLCSINNNEALHCALMPKKECGYFRYVANSVRRKLRLQVGTTVDITLRQDESELQFNVPEEFSEVLRNDPEAADVPEKLASGNRRGLVSLATQVNSMDK